MDVVEFLRARLDEDDRLARSALAETPVESGRETRYPYPERLATCMHNGRHGPARVLREVEAKRAILAAWASAESRRPPKGEWYEYAQGIGDGRADALRDAVKILAAVYGDHPDYRQEWKP
jgi:hypothetical protein